MAIELDKKDTKEIILSLQHYFREELEMEISEMRAKFLLDYFLKEIAPFAYNKGVRDAEFYFRSKIEDLPGTCFEEGPDLLVEEEEVKQAAKVSGRYLGGDGNRAAQFAEAERGAGDVLRALAERFRANLALDRDDAPSRLDL